MSHYSHHMCPKTYARVAGICYLVIIVTGILGQLFLKDSLVTSVNSTSTNQAIMTSTSLWRIGVFSDIVMQIFDIPLIVILYFLFKPTDKNIALLALSFNIIQTAVLVANKLTVLVPMIIVKNAGYQTAFEPNQINAQLNLLGEIHNYGFALGLIFFGFACLAYGYLIFHSGYFPKLIGILIFIAGASYLIYSFTLILEPHALSYVGPVLIMCFVGELSFCLWLLIKGVDIQKWNSAIIKTNSNIAA